jgi:hypothetical protein
VNCDDGNPCTRDYCTSPGFSDPECQHDPTNEGSECGFDEIALTCREGLCGAELLCEGVECDDNDLCTEDVCAWNGECAFTEISCDDGDQCSADRCDRNTGACEYTPFLEDGASCTLDLLKAEIGGCQDGVCVAPCDPDSQEELECPVEFNIELVCCPGREPCLPTCSTEASQ